MLRAVSLLVLFFLACATRAEIYSSGAPRSTGNDDTCDIALLPAATLLLPYFEVDLNAPPGEGETTLFTILNVTKAHARDELRRQMKRRIVAATERGDLSIQHVAQVDALCVVASELNVEAEKPEMRNRSTA
jgi:hypothetical protein